MKDLFNAEQIEKLYEEFLSGYTSTDDITLLRFDKKRKTLNPFKWFKKDNELINMQDMKMSELIKIYNICEQRFQDAEHKKETAIIKMVEIKAIFFEKTKEEIEEVIEEQNLEAKKLASKLTKPLVNLTQNI